MNPAANPLETNKKFVTIKRPDDYDTVKSLSCVKEFTAGAKMAPKDKDTLYLNTARCMQLKKGH